MACARSVTMREFRGMDLMSGSLRVHGRSRPRREARPPRATANQSKQLDLAATDDKSGKRVGEDAPSSGATATSRKKCAGAAERKPKAVRATEKTNRKNYQQGSGGEEPRSLWDQKAELGGGDELPEDGAEFVAAVQKEIDLVELAVFVLRRGDERLTQRQLEQLLDMKYGRSTRGTENTAKRVVVDIPSAAAERAREREHGS